MSEQRALAKKHLTALRHDAEASRIPTDVIGRALLAQIIELWTEERDWQDVANELRFTADSLDPDSDFEFMRP